MSDTDIDIIVKGKDEASAALGGAGKSVKTLGDSSDTTTGKLGGMASMLGGPIVAGATAAAGAIIAIGAAAFSMASDMDGAMRTLQKQLDLTRGQAEELRPVIADIFKKGIVDSAGEAAQAVAEARRQFGDASNNELSEFASKGLLISKTFGDDYQKVMATAGTLHKEFGISGTEALDRITNGYQHNLNASGDMLDSMGEYGHIFAANGGSAEEFFKIQAAGQQGGVLGTDKINDAYKEFFIRIKDGSDTSKKAINDIFAATGILDTKTIALKNTEDELNAALKTNANDIKTAQQVYSDSAETVGQYKDALSQAQSELQALGGGKLAGLQEIDDQLFALQAQAKQASLAMLGNKEALASAQATYTASAKEVDRLGAALQKAKGELSAMAVPKLEGTDLIEEQLFGLGQLAKKLKLQMLEMVPDGTRIQARQRDLDAATRALAQNEFATESVTQGIRENEDALKSAKGAYATSQAQVTKLTDALNKAKNELNDLAHPNLVGMEQYDNQIFDVEQQIKAARLAMIGMDEDSPSFKSAQTNLDGLNDHLEQLQLQRDLQYDTQIRNIEKAAESSTKPVLTYAAALQQIADKKTEIGGLENAVVDANSQMERNGLTVDRLAIQNEHLNQVVKTLADAHQTLATNATNAKTALDAAKAPTAQYEAAQVALDQINTQMDRLALERDLTIEPQLRTIQQAAEEGQQPAVSYADALQQIADKKTEIAGLSTAFDAANATMQTNKSTVDTLSAAFAGPEAALADLNAQIDRLSVQRDIQFEPQLRAIQSALTDTGEPALTVEETLQRIGEKKAQIGDLEVALSGAESQTAHNRDRVTELKDQQELLNTQIANTKEALTKVITPADEFIEKLRTGQITGKEAADFLLQRLDMMPDKIKRNIDGVALFGAQWEDLGGDVARSSEVGVTALDGWQGAANRLDDANQDLGNQWTQIWNTIKESMSPVGDELLKLVQEHMPELRAAGQWLADFLRDNLPGAIQTVVTNFHDFERGLGVVKGVFDDTARGAEYLGQKIQEVQRYLAGLDDKLPDWLRPGSPTPFEIGLKGISEEMAGLVRSELPRFAAGLDLAAPLLPDLSAGVAGASGGGAGAGAAGNLYVTNQIGGSVVTQDDLMRATVEALRRMSRQNGGLAAMGITL